MAHDRCDSSKYALQCLNSAHPCEEDPFEGKSSFVEDRFEGNCISIKFWINDNSNASSTKVHVIPRTSLTHPGSIGRERFPNGATIAGKHLHPVLSSLRNKRLAKGSFV